jgi:hypothetical protein
MYEALQYAGIYAIGSLFYLVMTGKWKGMTMKNRVIWSVTWAIVGGLIGFVVFGSGGKPNSVEAQNRGGGGSKHQLYLVDQISKGNSLTNLNESMVKRGGKVISFNEQVILIEWP